VLTVTLASLAVLLALALGLLYFAVRFALGLEIV
jgi:hypothetical protein